MMGKLYYHLTPVVVPKSTTTSVTMEKSKGLLLMDATKTHNHEGNGNWTF